MYLMIFLSILVMLYLIWVFIKLGFHQRLPLVFSKISLENIPDRADKKYGNHQLFTIDVPAEWSVPQHSSLYIDPLEWSASRIKSTAGYVAAVLRNKLEIEHGDRVALVKKNHFDIFLLHSAIIRSGGISCPMHGDFSSVNVQPYLNNIGAKCVISDEVTLFRFARENADFGKTKKVLIAHKKTENSAELAALFAEKYPHLPLWWIEEALAGELLEAAYIPRGKEEPLFMTHTSGTTGFPKAVILKNGGQSHAVRGMLTYAAASRRDKAFMALPFNHQAVILTFNSLLLLGVRAHWTSCSKSDFDPKATLACLSAQKYTAFFGFPITYTQMLHAQPEKYDLKGMRIWACTADASHEVHQRAFAKLGGFFSELGLPIKGGVFVDGQGSSEVGTPSVIRFVTSLTRKFDRRIGFPGLVPFGPKIKVINKEGKPVVVGEPGRLFVKGKTVFEGYWNNHSKTYEEICDRWFFTGDVVKRVEDGNLVQLDREVDVIKSKQGDVYSLMIEEAVHKHPAVYDACVFAARQDDGFQMPAAVVALKEGFFISENELLRELNENLLVNERLSSLKIIPWSEFPIGLTGKTLKRSLRDLTERQPIEEMNRPIFA